MRQLLLWLRARGDGYEQALQYPDVIRVAIDHEHVDHGEPIAGAREIALFPPMTAARLAVAPLVRVQAGDFDIAAEIDRICRGRADIGAVVTFSGLCRDEAGTLAALELEHYPGMAEAQIALIAQEAVQRWPLCGLTAIHRHGRISPGETIVLVVAASAHRQAAFDAASFLMDYLKSRAPFWKKEQRLDGSEGSWVAAKDSDDDAAARWHLE